MSKIWDLETVKTWAIFCEETAKEKTLAEGAKALLADYTEDQELLSFTAPDSEGFYEAK